MGRSFYIIAFLIGFLAGVLVWPLIFLKAGLMIGVSTVFLILSFLAKGPLKLVTIFFLALFLGFLRAQAAGHLASPDQIDFYNETFYVFDGVVREVDTRRDNTKYLIEVRGALWGNVLVTLNKYPLFKYGDFLKIEGQLKTPIEFEGFSYKNYLDRFGIYSVMYYPKVSLLAQGQGSFFWMALYQVQDGFLAQIGRVFPEPFASFMAGLLVGARKGIPPALMDQFNITGLSHIIAISGFNITIIIACVMGILAFLPRMKRFYTAVAVIILFTLFVGASPAVVRASIMGILGLIALNFGRQNNIHLTVLYTAFFMVLYNPKILWWDVGFQLSFAAVLGLIYLAPLFKCYAEKLPETLGVREAILMTLSANIMALPIIVYNFDRLSIVSPLSNLLVSFAIPLAMLTGFISVMLSFLFMPLGLLVGYIGWGVLSYILAVTEWTSKIPHASLYLPGMRLWMMAVYYALLILFIVFKNADQRILERRHVNP